MNENDMKIYVNSFLNKKGITNPPSLTVVN